MKKSTLNHVYRLVWNTTLGAFVPVSENTKSKGKTATKLRRSVAAIGIALASSSVWAEPSSPPIIVDGAGGSGVFIGSHFGGPNNLVVGDADDQTVFTGFFTEGGAGSGGGAGLGGAFFVDDGAALTVRNGVFIGNKIKGGEGGALPASRLGDTLVNNSPFTLDLLGYEQQLIKPTLTFNAVSGEYEFDTIEIDSGTQLLNDGTNISFGELSGNQNAVIASTTSNSVLLGSTVSIDANDIESTGATVRFFDPASNQTVTAVSGYEVNGDTINFYEANDGELDDLRSKLALNGQIFIDGQNAIISAVNYGASGKIESITLDKDLTGASNAGDLDVISVTKFNTQQFALNGNDVAITGDLRGFREGMSLFDADGNSLGATITAVSNDGSSFTVDNAANLSGVSSLSAKQSPILANNQVVLSNPNSEFAVGVSVYVPDSNFTATVTAYDANTGTVTFDQNLSQSIIDNVNDGEPLTLAVRNILGVSGDTLTIRKTGDQQFESGMTINGNNIAADSSILSVTDNGDSYTVVLSAGAVEDSNITSIVARSPLSKGGSLNGMTATGNSGSNGNNGFDANYYSSFFDGGEGGEGTRGYAGDEGSTGEGFNGGDGGNGSDGLSANLQLVTELYGATTDFIDSVGELAGAIAPDGFPPVPDYADIPFAVVDLAAKSVSLATATANTVLWAQNLERGLAGMGGEGGEGGEGGAGAEFFGGGSGGDGGSGGEGARSYTDGGNGGDGGRGGDGGFGAGGGNGGAGGDGGSTGAADGADGGDGGFGGFGAGDGRNGNGLFGGGGSGFGGAIFVREGGNLLIEGESLFENNTAAGGSSNNRGAAGDGAGAAIFMMKGADVTLSPGLGNTIRFEDDIADNSSATYEGAPAAEGNGADITIAGNGGVVIFNAENTYTGDTILEGATLDAEFGTGIHDSSRVRFNGAGTVGASGINALGINTVGTLLQKDDVTSKRQGVLSHEITWTGSGGFASGIEEGIRVNLGETIGGIGQTLVWGSNGFFEGAAANSTLTFGSEQSLGTVTFENDVLLNNNTSRVAVYNTGIDETSFATLSGAWTGGDIMIGSDVYSGTVFLTGDNQFDNVTVEGGLVTTEGGGTLSETGNNANILITGGTLDLIQDEALGTTDVESGGTLNAKGFISATDITNNGTINATGGVDADNIYNNSGNTFNAFSDVNVTSVIENTMTGQWNQKADVSAQDIINDGNWRIFGLDNADGTRHITTETLTGNGMFSLDTTADNTGSLTLTQTDDSTFDGIIEGLGSVEKAGAGHLRISNTHTFTGGLDVTGGVVETLAATLTPNTTGGLLADTGAVHVFDNASFIAGNNDTVGSVEVDALGSFVLNADITTGNDFTNNGTSSLTADRTLTTGGGLAGSGLVTIANGAELTLVQSGETTYSGDMTGEGGFIKDGTGTLTLSGNADSVNLDAGLTINGGKLSLDGAFILNENQDVLVNENGELELVSGNQKIDQLSGEGVIDLNVNTLQVNNGGDFEGLVVGNGILDILNGSFNVNNSISSENGAFNVNSGATATVGANSSLNFADITVQDSGTLDVVGQATTNNLVVATNSTLHLGDLNSAGSVDSMLASVYGTLSGNGDVSNTVNVYGGGLLDPGNSPGILTFTDLNMLSGSVANMEIISSGVAGTDFDQIQVSGDLTINDGTRLDIIKFGAAAELTMGETVNIFNFAPGSVSGQFGSATSTYTNEVIYNLATGDVVGLGTTSTSDFKSEVANTQNQKAMLASLEVETAGGVSQFYGGNLVPAIAEAYGDTNAVNTVFEKSSPEVYASLNDQARLSLVNDLDDIFIDDKAERGLSLNVRQGTNSSDNGGSWANYDLDYNKTQLMYTLPYSEGAIRAAFSEDSRDIASRYLSADTEGYSFSLSVSHSLPLEGLSLLANVSSISQSSDVYRETLTGSSSVKDIDANGRMLGLGVIYQQKMDDLLLTGTLGAMHFNTKVSAFDELNTTTLEALSVDEQRTSGNAILAKVGIASQVDDKWTLGSELSYLHMNGASDYDVTANVAVEERNFTVSNPGAGESLLGLNLSAQYQIENNWVASFDAKVTGENSLSGDYQAKLGIDYSF